MGWAGGVGEPVVGRMGWWVGGEPSCVCGLGLYAMEQNSSVSSIFPASNPSLLSKNPRRRFLVHLADDQGELMNALPAELWAGPQAFFVCVCHVHAS